VLSTLKADPDLCDIPVVMRRTISPAEPLWCRIERVTLLAGKGNVGKT
jgi:hypothetical protein